MAEITTYATLQANLVEWLNRTGDTDATAAAPTIIQMAEGRLARNHRIRKLTCRGTWTITADGDAAPDDFAGVDVWEHDGTVYYGPIELLDDLSDMKARESLTKLGPPAYATIKAGRFYYAPQPDQVYTTRLSYRRKIVPLSDTTTTNWLLEDHPDIYLMACMAEGQLYLKNAAAAQVWEGKLNVAIDEMSGSNWDLAWGGGRLARPMNAIGG